ncbi:MAG: SagB/ThcOx family dehydrogenase [Candidatus Nitrohelix vancouverensis]|uniref:SagB/ThcOx family dehydrogenase n=1 Tax=Candidatus Nitrohelix vancouverensis TaxID=2705534 RepID=A0A7T0C5I2_9BACT|nr:MAG: SagB/ThcOx family dehydrogenase [Candidatus Nitrohelix vancouverensis]
MARRYHQYSKHDYYRSAPSPGFMDWSNQPDPFRRYEGAALVALKKIELRERPYYHEVLRPGHLPASPMNHETISQLFFDSLAISAWKSFQGSRWALRVNPSSGNLHPTEGHLICGPMPGIDEVPTVSHYTPQVHGLELRATLSESAWNRLSEGYPEGVVFVGLSTIHWREAWKYGLRAFRYCNHDMGHALAAISLAAATLGWKTRLLDHLDAETLQTILALDTERKGEAEIAECLIAVSPQDATALPTRADFVEGFAGLEWQGQANQLSEEHIDWDGIGEVSNATRKTGDADFAGNLQSRGSLARLICEDTFSMREAMHQRRSAVAMDGRTRISRDTFFQFMQNVHPDVCPIPFNTMLWEPQIHLGVFVHRVDDLPPGLYFLLRNKDHLGDLKEKMKPGFDWERPEGCPPELDFFRLEEDNFQSPAASVSCGQDIAGQSCFSLGMFSAFEKATQNYSAAMYPRLYWECGAIGQVLYLQAEVSGVRSTGIGCFFDDPARAIFGLRDNSYQSLYHFTVGGAVDDSRLTTLPAYPES